MTIELLSFSSEHNDSARMSAIRQSRNYGVWHCVTVDGDKWVAHAYLPNDFVQAVVFVDGRRKEVIGGNLGLKKEETELSAQEPAKIAAKHDMLPRGVVIMSAFRPEYHINVNMERHECLANTIRLNSDYYGRKVQTTLGSWEGKQEISMMVDVSDAGVTDAYIANLMRLADDYDQDAILYVNTQGCAFIVVKDGDHISMQYIGLMIEMHPHDISKHNGWTQIIGNDGRERYYTVQ